jgi:hypothetical protein
MRDVRRIQSLVVADTKFPVKVSLSHCNAAVRKQTSKVAGKDPPNDAGVKQKTH